MWVGRKDDYINDGARESNGIFWIREGVGADGEPRAGFNAGMFLGNEPFSIPSGDGYIEVLPKRDGTNAPSRVFMSGCVSLAPLSELSACAYAIDLLLVPHDYHGGGAGVVRSGIGTAEGIDQFVSVKETPGAEHIPGSYAAYHTQLDSRNKAMDLKTIAVSGSVMAPPGNYKVFIRITRKAAVPKGTSSHGAFQYSVFGMQVGR